jgi:hypothetical protein
MIRSLALIAAAAPALAGPVRVELDMDSGTPGIQSSVTLPPGTAVVPGVAVYIYDPEGTRSVLSIGYLGAIDRGISFGHTPTPGLIGHVMSLSASEGTPVNPANTGFVFPAMDPGFIGPEVQYIELNAAAPALIQQTPAEPIFKVDIELMGATEGDIFNFYLLDFVSVWRSGLNAAFTTHAGTWLDTGGDSVPDGTQALFGVDPDVPIAVPPAAFLVDYIDGPGRVIIADVCYPDCNGSGTLTISDFGCFQAAFSAGNMYADCNASGTLTIADFGCFQAAFAAGCP